MRARLSRRIAIPVECTIALAFLAIVLSLALIRDLPFSLPSASRAAFVGVHYLYPLLGIAIWAAILLFARKQPVLPTFFVALPCYALILVCHFNVKLWVPHVNPALWDDLYWNADQALRPLVDAAYAMRAWLDPVIPLESNFYMVGFIAMFYLAFGYACAQDQNDFRKLVVAAMLLHSLGALSYLVAPAIGPFLYETGLEPRSTQSQAGMLASYQANIAGGRAWLASEGSRQITVGLAAMPSLHAGGSFLFLAHSWRYRSSVRWVLLALFAFLSIDAIANRWHYVVDVPAGVLLAALCLYLAHRLVGTRADGPSAEIAPAGAGSTTKTTPAASGVFRLFTKLFTRFRQYAE